MSSPFSHPHPHPHPPSAPLMATSPPPSGTSAGGMVPFHHSSMSGATSSSSVLASWLTQDNDRKAITLGEYSNDEAFQLLRRAKLEGKGRDKAAKYQDCLRILDTLHLSHGKGDDAEEDAIYEEAKAPFAKGLMKIFNIGNSAKPTKKQRKRKDGAVTAESGTLVAEAKGSGDVSIADVVEGAVEKKRKSGPRGKDKEKLVCMLVTAKYVAGSGEAADVIFSYNGNDSTPAPKGIVVWRWNAEKTQLRSAAFAVFIPFTADKTASYPVVSTCDDYVRIFVVSDDEPIRSVPLYVDESIRKIMVAKTILMNAIQTVRVTDAGVELQNVKSVREYLTPMSSILNVKKPAASKEAVYAQLAKFVGVLHGMRRPLS
jgi:hypothetical protein